MRYVATYPGEQTAGNEREDHSEYYRRTCMANIFDVKPEYYDDNSSNHFQKGFAENSLASWYPVFD